MVISKDFLPDLPDHIGKTTIEYTPASSILGRGSGFLDGFDFIINAYRGCQFKCQYCYVDGGKFLERFAKDRDWGDWVDAKLNAVQLLDKRKPGSLDGKHVYMSSATDPYQPIERTLKLTRGILEVLVEKHPYVCLIVQTRGPLITRDIDLLLQLPSVIVNMTITTDDDDIRRTFEPQCPTAEARIKAITEISQAGIRSCITMTPLLLLKDARMFAESLLATGVQEFIVQAFHENSQGKYAARTKGEAYELMAAKLECSIEEVWTYYGEHYRKSYAILQEMLPNLGVGKSGFAPKLNNA